MDEAWGGGGWVGDFEVFERRELFGCLVRHDCGEGCWAVVDRQTEEFTGLVLG